jgi:hypothetical protein
VGVTNVESDAAPVNAEQQNAKLQSANFGLWARLPERLTRGLRLNTSALGFVAEA